VKKTILTPALLLIAALMLFSCSRNTSPKKVVITSSKNPHGLPPGQAKKVTGSQSAKPYAPGQQKKSGGTTVVIK
jgi:hypothetical protein